MILIYLEYIVHCYNIPKTYIYFLYAHFNKTGRTCIMYGNVCPSVRLSVNYSLVPTTTYKRKKRIS